MEDNKSEVVGNVDVRVSKSEIYKAVRNILANEFKLDPNEVKEQTKKHAEQKIQEEVIDYIGKSGWTKGNVEERIRLAIDRKINDLTPIVKEVVKSLVHEKIKEELEGVVGAIIENGMKFQIGWYPRREINVKIEEKK